MELHEEVINSTESYRIGKIFKNETATQVAKPERLMEQIKEASIVHACPFYEKRTPT